MQLNLIYESWLKEKKALVKPTTLAAYSYLMEHHLLPVFGDKENITKEDLQTFVNQCKARGMRRNSLNSILSVIGMVTRYGADKGWCLPLNDPPKLPPHSQSNLVDILTVKEESVLVRHLLAQGKLLDIALLMSITAGLRLGEVCGLMVGDLQLSHQQCLIRRTVSITYDHNQHQTFLTVNLPKTVHSLRQVPIHPLVEERLHKLVPPPGIQDCYLFTAASHPLHPNVLRKHFRQTLQALSLPTVRFHALRHTFATRCIESGCDVKTLSSILGHSNVQTTMNLYVHPSMQQKQQCLADMMQYVLNGA